MYTQYQQAWLEDPSAIRIVLVEAQVYDITLATTSYLYLSTASYITTDGTTSFLPIIKSNITVSETLTLDGTGAMTFGDIEIANPNGEYDTYFDPVKYVWSNKTIKIYYGDAQWICANIAEVRTKFLTIFNGVIDDADSRNRVSFNLKIRDKLERLNVPLAVDKIGTYGTWASGQQNQDTIKPIVFGEVFNITPILIDPSLLEYEFNNGNTERLIEIRDNGALIYNSNTASPSYTIAGATVNLTTGTFQLTRQSIGAITCSVQGVTKSLPASPTSTSTVSLTYSNTIADIITAIVTEYGSAGTRFTFADLDLTNLVSAKSTYTTPVGCIVTDTANILAVCRNILSSAGLQLFITRAGLLRILRYGSPFVVSADVSGVPGAPDPIITDADILYNSLSISSRPIITAAIKLGYCQNYTVQPNLLTAIPQAHKDTFALDWLTVTSVNQNLVSLYSLPTDVPQVYTSLITTEDAQTEADRRRTYYSGSKTVYKFTGTTRLLGLQLGQTITLISGRFNLYNSGTGVTGQVITLSPNWTTGRVDIEVLI